MGTFGKPVKKKHPLRNAFLKATLAGVLLFPAYEKYTPQSVQDKVADAVTEVTHIHAAKADPAQLKFVFDNDNTANVLGEQSKSDFYANVNIRDEWFATMGRHNMLLRNDDNAANYKSWLRQLDGLRGKSVAEKAKAVDALVDKQIQYVSDIENYHQEDYFASPMETISRGKGDCEDFAILKYYALRYLDVPAERMYVVAVGEDGTKLNHATLMVNTYEEGMLKSAWSAVSHKLFKTEIKTQYAILDNDSSPEGKLVEARDARYHPYYAMNEKEFRSVPKNSDLRW